MKPHPPIAPALLVNDLAETLNFYGKLGFDTTGFYPCKDQPTWAEVSKEGAVLQFHSDAPCGMPTKPICSGTFYFYIENVVAFANLIKNDVELLWGPKEMEY